MGASAVLRWARASTLASVMLASGLSGHVAAGGFAPTSSVLLPVFVLLVAAVAPFLDAPASTKRVAALLVVGQGVLHVVLQVLGGSSPVQAAGDATATPVGHAGGPLTHGLAHGNAPTSPGDAMTAVAGAHLGMLLAHVAAAVVVGLWLAAGERAAWTLVTVAALPVVDAWVTLRELSSDDPVTGAAEPSPPLPRWDHERATRPAMWAGRGMSRRGPPRLSAPLA